MCSGAPKQPHHDEPLRDSTGTRGRHLRLSGLGPESGHGREGEWVWMELTSERSSNTKNKSYSSMAYPST